MDWPKENLGISEIDLRNVFKYERKTARVLRLEGPEKGLTVRSLETDEDWGEWMEKELPSPDSRTSGLVLILARRTGQQRTPAMRDELDGLEKGLSRSDRTMTFPIEVGGAPNAEKGLQPSLSGRRSARTLPFSLEIFRSISKRLCLHGSIARVISRSDVPVFSRAELQMGLPGGPTYPAYVYNCRSTNAWEMDLALTATHFPHSGITYAVLFGCPISIEEEVIKRLSSAGEAASYPLLLPGIFAELERNRHIKIVEDYMDDIEEKIFELDSRPSVTQRMHTSDGDRRNKDKRSQWLDTTYLRNGLITWREQLAKMARHTDELGDTLFMPARENDAHVASNSYQYSTIAQKVRLGGSELPSSNAEGDWMKSTDADYLDKDELQKSEMRKIGGKVNDRLHSIIEEYEDKIRECTMRIDGMAMATQWSHGDTNVEIALATGRDSRHMRTISIVTMVFLPGTFFASVFSMQFFNWIPSDDGTVVSHYLWIYFLVTVVATLLTLGTWYYFVVWRPRSRREVSEDEIPLVA
ncbi:hypothetical protein F5Y05DRAFT_414590 [Hypoxylon sp. FL0543]|nr:hypothetical protein F5Y05DRAFT_414590 [Hypoxylon sp. FL0543]